MNELENRSPSRISRKELEKVTVPPWPKVEEILAWKPLVIQNICIASGDNDFDEWEERLKPTMTLKPDLDELGKQTPPSFNLLIRN